MSKFDPYLVLSVMQDLESLAFSSWEHERNAFERVRDIFAQMRTTQADAQELKTQAKALWLIEYAEQCFAPAEHSP